MRKTLSIIICCLFIVSVFVGCGILQKLGIEKDGSDELQPASSVAIGEEEAKKLSDKVPIHLYFANEDSSKLKLEVRHIPISEAKKSVNNLAGIVVKELINGPTKKGLKATIPEDTKLIKSSVPIKSGVATVNLSKDFVDKHPGGKEAERLTIYSIVNSLTEIKDIQEVKFLINGKVCETYKGFFKFDAAFPRNVSIISNEVTSDSETAESSSDLGASSSDNDSIADKDKLDNNDPEKDKDNQNKSETSKNDPNKDKDNSNKDNSDKDKSVKDKSSKDSSKENNSKKSGSGLDMEESDQSFSSDMSNITVDSDGTILE
ncbi:GerMN domain-containing protein [Pseudobacteroides cellulosolvens]|uniref:Lipoprotein LpqB, GerMN domain-containing protein n=1 Tax=Pseudobacteroides cellulosolvens ATCC 35603 = DSM 2933 TaxID=398512 RepID=A0A0L6JMZ8_9FIRM|nr:GerMN domain-containing protein [Pseudobacteroides cellulosolvens]KNY27110.1 Lipoprotein LpqB, GerMN domain-containing protein [Pseudobacteroides cellulosolvens ATCC 35603 = DSM 2933]